MKHCIIYKEKNRYCSFPHISYVDLQKKKLAVIFRRASQFSAEAAKNGCATHHDPNSSIEVIFSQDEGESWPTETMKTVYQGQYGVNDPALTLLSDESLLARFVALKILPTQKAASLTEPFFSHRVEHGLVTNVVGNWLMRSFDCGNSWQEMGVAQATEENFTRSCSRDPIIEMPDGSLLMSVYTGAPKRSDRAWVLRSFDRGKTWREPILIMQDPKGEWSQLQGVNYNETSLLHFGNGEVLALVRGDGAFHTEGELMPVGGVGELYCARSFDGGLSWTSAIKTGLWGQPGSLLLLSNGDLLATYGYRKKPYGVRSAISRDRGYTWQVGREYIIREDAPTWDVGYPFSIQLRDGKIFSVYYFVDQEGTRHIAGTKWDLL